MPWSYDTLNPSPSMWMREEKRVSSIDIKFSSGNAYKKRLRRVCGLPECDVAVGVTGPELVALLTEPDSIHLRKHPGRSYILEVKMLVLFIYYLTKRFHLLKKWHVDLTILTCHFLIEKSLLYELFIRNMHLGFFDKVDKLSWILDHLKGTTLDYLIPEQAVRVTIPTFWWIRPESPSRLEKMEKSVRIANSNVRIWFEIISSIRNIVLANFPWPHIWKDLLLPTLKLNMSWGVRWAENAFIKRNPLMSNCVLPHLTTRLYNKLETYQYQGFLKLYYTCIWPSLFAVLLIVIRNIRMQKNRG